MFREDNIEEAAILKRDDGSFLVSGWMPIDEFADEMGFSLDKDFDYETVAGFVINELKRLPALGESFTAKGWRFEVIDLDGRRVDKLLVSRIPEMPDVA